jgi:LysM repeat protein
MGGRWRTGYIALTAVVVTLAIASAIFSHARPEPSQRDALPTPTATPSPSRTPRPTLPPLTPTAATPTSTPISTATLRPSPTFLSYVVQTGETLAAIAHKFGVTLNAILAANPNITDARQIKAGQTILIPPPGWTPRPGPSSSKSPGPS